jgi:hypothetical protein
MPQRWRNVALAPAALWVLALAAHAAEPSCFKCHDPQRKQFVASAHAQAGLGCVDCHGGNPNATDETAHATDNFKRPDSKQAIAELCASCHADVRRMNPYGLPTDQFARYKTSKHGEQLFEHNDQNVAVCTDCHGAHDITSPKSPTSHVYPTNIPGTCGRCHADAKLMDRYKLPSDVVAQYKTSYHAYMVFEKGDLSAPTCVTCHGSHGATPPGTAQVGEVCGKCHGRQRELFSRSPHAEAASAGLFSECVSCHGNHAIQKASLELFATACIKCHANDPEQLRVRDQVAGLIRQNQQSYDRATTLVQAATVRGLATEDDLLLLQEAKTQLMQLEALQHTLSMKELQPIADRQQELIKQTQADVAELDKIQHWKRLALWPVWGFLTIMAVLFWLKRRQIEQQT